MKRAKALLHTAFDWTACASSLSTVAARRSWMCVDGLMFSAWNADMVLGFVRKYERCVCFVFSVGLGMSGPVNEVKRLSAIRDWDKIEEEAFADGFNQNNLAEALGMQADPCGVRIWEIAFNTVLESVRDRHVVLKNKPAGFNNGSDRFSEFAKKHNFKREFDYESAWLMQARKSGTNKLVSCNPTDAAFPDQDKYSAFVTDLDRRSSLSWQDKKYTQKQSPDGIFSLSYSDEAGENYEFFIVIESDGDDKDTPQDKYAWDHAKKLMQCVDANSHPKHDLHAFMVRINLLKVNVRKLKAADHDLSDVEIAIAHAKKLYQACVVSVTDILKKIGDCVDLNHSRKMTNRYAYTYWICFKRGQTNIGDYIFSWETILGQEGYTDLRPVFPEKCVFPFQHSKMSGYIPQMSLPEMSSCMIQIPLPLHSEIRKLRSEMQNDTAKPSKKWRLWCARNLFQLINGVTRYYVDKYIVVFLPNGTPAETGDEQKKLQADCADHAASKIEKEGCWADSPNDVMFKQGSGDTEYLKYDTQYFRIVEFLVELQEMSLKEVWTNNRQKPQGDNSRQWRNFGLYMKLFSQYLIEHGNAFVDRSQIKLNMDEYPNYLAYKKNDHSLAAYLSRDAHERLPALDERLNKYIKNLNIPQAALFLRMIRCSSLAVLQELARQYKKKQMSDRMDKLLRQMPVCTESELRWLFDRILSRPILLVDLDEGRDRDITEISSDDNSDDDLGGSGDDGDGGDDPQDPDLTKGHTPAPNPATLDGGNGDKSTASTGGGKSGRGGSGFGSGWTDGRGRGGSMSSPTTLDVYDVNTRQLYIEQEFPRCKLKIGKDVHYFLPADVSKNLFENYYSLLDIQADGKLLDGISFETLWEVNNRVGMNSSASNGRSYIVIISVKSSKKGTSEVDYQLTWTPNSTTYFTDENVRTTVNVPFAIPQEHEHVETSVEGLLEVLGKIQNKNKTQTMYDCFVKADPGTSHSASGGAASAIIEDKYKITLVNDQKFIIDATEVNKPGKKKELISKLIKTPAELQGRSWTSDMKSSDESIKKLLQMIETKCSNTIKDMWAIFIVYKHSMVDGNHNYKLKIMARHEQIKVTEGNLEFSETMTLDFSLNEIMSFLWLNKTAMTQMFIIVNIKVEELITTWNLTITRKDTGVKTTTAFWPPWYKFNNLPKVEDARNKPMLLYNYSFWGLYYNASDKTFENKVFVLRPGENPNDIVVYMLKRIQPVNNIDLVKTFFPRPHLTEIHPDNYIILPNFNALIDFARHQAEHAKASNRYNAHIGEHLFKDYEEWCNAQNALSSQFDIEKFYDLDTLLSCSIPEDQSQSPHDPEAAERES